jgi:hypothetical protein
MNSEKLELPKQTLSQLENISHVLKDNDCGSVLAQCVNLGEMLLNKIQNGDSIYIESRNGKRIELTLPSGT